MIDVHVHVHVSPARSQHCICASLGAVPPPCSMAPAHLSGSQAKLETHGGCEEIPCTNVEPMLDGA